VDWIGVAQDRNRWRALVNPVLNFRVLWNAGKLSSGITSSGLSSSARLHRDSQLPRTQTLWMSVNLRFSQWWLRRELIMFWDMQPCTSPPAEVVLIASCLLRYLSTLKKVAVRRSEPVAKYYRTTRRYISVAVFCSMKVNFELALWRNILVPEHWAWIVTAPLSPEQLF
jgi:hypothetical protein